LAISDSLGEVRQTALPAGTIQYRVRGSGPTLVFAHGAFVNGDLWRKVVPLLADDFRCVTPDWPLGGHRLAMRPDADLSPPALAQLVIDFVDELGDDEVTLVSNDTATAIAQLVLARNPARIRRAVLTTGDLFKHFFPLAFKPLQGLGYVPGALRVVGLLNSTRHAKRVGLAPVSKTLKDPAIMDSYLDPPRQNPAVRRDLGKLLRGISSRYTMEVAPRLRAFDGRVLLVWSRDDRFFPLRDAERLVTMFEDAELVAIPDTRTFISEDRPEALVEAMRAFLSG
jgi:pimeloyl-ACP methyl ester carboxylesterase